MTEENANTVVERDINFPTSPSEVVASDRVGGDKITVGDIGPSAIAAIGHEAKVSVTQVYGFEAQLTLDDFIIQRNEGKGKTI
jgi:hypothetical protein